MKKCIRWGNENTDMFDDIKKLLFIYFRCNNGTMVYISESLSFRDTQWNIYT